MRHIFIKDIDNTVWVFSLDNLVNFSHVTSEKIHTQYANCEKQYYREVTFTQRDKGMLQSPALAMI